MGFKKGDENYSRIHGSWNKGLKLGPNPEHSKKMKGCISWNKGKKGLQVAWNKGILTTEETKKKISKACKGKRLGNTNGFTKGQIPWNKGKPYLAIRGDNHPLWKGGITPVNKAIRESLKYKQWRKTVFEGDNYTCQICGQIGGELNADHIKPFSLFPKLRFELLNGRTLCKPCHKEIGWELFRENNPMKKQGFLSP